jgi:hypothetical protein
MIPGLHDEGPVRHEGRLVYAEAYIDAIERKILASGQVPCPVPHALRFDGEPCGRCGAQA